MNRPDFTPLPNIGQAQILAAQTALRYLREGADHITVNKLVALSGVADESARKALRKLEKKGLLVHRQLPGTGSPRAYSLKAV